MRILLSLALNSLLNRRVTTSLTVLSIALSVGLLLGVERVRSGAKSSFSETISQTDLIVGARGGNLALLLYSVFQMGNPTNNISIESYNQFSSHPAIKWTFPISLGDSHQGFRVIATTKAFFEHYRFGRDRKLAIKAGGWNGGLFDVVIGSDVAKSLGYGIGDSIIVAHGAAQGPALFEHTENPFKVAGILERTTTPVDRALYISLEAMEAIHTGESTTGLNAESLQPKQITAFFAAARSRPDVLRLLREINEYTDEPLLAIVPAITLSELWQSLSYAEASLQVIAGLVVIISILGMLISIYTTLNERRREVSILRAIGGSQSLTVSLFAIETIFLTFTGCLIGIGALYSVLAIAQSAIQDVLGVYIPIEWLGLQDAIYLTIVLGPGAVAGLLIGWKAHRNGLSDGLTIRV